MNSKIILGIIIGVLGAALGVIAFTGPQIFNDVSEGGFGKISSSPIKVIPIQVDLEKLEVLSVTDEEARIKLDFKVTNTNYKSVILQVIKYELYSDGKRVTIGEIGERPEGAVDSSNYFTILSNNPQTIGELVILKNTGADPDFWTALSNNSINWKVKGEADFNLSSMTSGQENIVPFEFTP